MIGTPSRSGRRSGGAGNGEARLLKAEIAHTRKLPASDVGPREVSFGIVGNNLLNDDVRNAASFKKDEVLLPGLSVRLFAAIRF